MCFALCTVHTRFEYIKKESLDLIFLWYAFRLWRNISTYLALEGSAVSRLRLRTIKLPDIVVSFSAWIY